MSKSYNWSKTKSKVYDDPLYKRNREIALKVWLGMCARCWHLHNIIVLSNVCDHYQHVKSSDKPDHSLTNLWILCDSCHSIKTAQESNGKTKSGKPFGDYDQDEDGWPINVDWKAVIDERYSQYHLKR